MLMKHRHSPSLHSYRVLCSSVLCVHITYLNSNDADRQGVTACPHRVNHIFESVLRSPPLYTDVQQPIRLMMMYRHVLRLTNLKIITANHLDIILE
jgi:hypothetical protein